MNKYRWIRPNHSVLRMDNVVIYNQIGSLDWEQFEIWLGQGNVPDPAPENIPVKDFKKFKTMPREIQAVLITISLLTNKTPAQVKTAFLTAWGKL